MLNEKTVLDEAMETVRESQSLVKKARETIEDQEKEIEILLSCLSCMTDLAQRRLNRINELESKQIKGLPQEAPYFCASCGSAVEKHPFTSVTHADGDGEPVERQGYGYYCSNKKCAGHLEAMEDDQLSSFPLTD